MKRFLTIIITFSFLVGCASTNLGDQRVHTGAGTIHQPCDTCAVYNVIFHTEKYPDESTANLIAKAINNSTPAQVVGVVATGPERMLETATGKRRYEVNVSFSIPADKLESFPEAIRAANEVFEKSNFNANKAATFKNT